MAMRALAFFTQRARALATTSTAAAGVRVSSPGAIALEDLLLWLSSYRWVCVCVQNLNASTGAHALALHACWTSAALQFLWVLYAHSSLLVLHCLLHLLSGGLTDAFVGP